MASILDMVQQQLGGGAIDQISRQIGADPGTTQSAVQMALPMLLGGLAHNATQPGGAEALHTALDDHTTTLDSLSGLLGGGGSAGAMPGNALGGFGGMLGGAGSGAAQGGGGFGGFGDLLGSAIGGKILGHVLGGRRGTVEQTVSQNTGLDPQQVGQLLMVLAPIVMGVLARKKQQEGLNPGQLGTVLQQNQQQVQQGGGLLGGLLGQVFGGRM
jgi:hypothetical protein